MKEEGRSKKEEGRGLKDVEFGVLNPQLSDKIKVT
jgi:hypothetical protein